MKSVRVRSHVARLLVLAATVSSLGAMSVIASCGSSTEPGSTTPKKDTVPATITSTTTGTLTAVVGSAVNSTLGVNVKNKAGEAVANALVTWTVATGGGAVSNPTVRTDSSGNASTTWTLGSAVGTQTVTATVGTLAPVTFSATATPSVQTTIAKVAGDNQTAVAGANVAVAPSVKITDKFNNPVPNVAVLFTANNNGSVSGASVSTDANGVATVGGWRLGNAVGANTLTATAGGIATPVTFTATGTVGSVTRVNITSAQIPQLQIGQTSTITAQAFDANNNQVTNATFTYSSDNTAVATVSSAGVVTAVGAGTATITVTSNGATATRSVTVIGHAGVTVAATIAMPGRPKNIATAGVFAYSGTNTAGIVEAVNAVTGTLAWADTIGGATTEVAVNAANTLLVSAGTNTAGDPYLFLINPATHKTTDSVALAAPPVHVVMNSTGTRAFVDENNFGLEIVDLGSKAVAVSSTIPGNVLAMKMAPNDAVLYAGTRLGTIFEVDATTGAVRRQFNVVSTVTDLDVSADSKSLVVSDGSPTVTFVTLASGGLTGTLSFGVANVTGVAFSPDMAQLWAATGSTIIAAPSDGGGSFNTGLNGGRTTVQTASFTRIVFLRDGSRAIAIDDGGLNLVIFK